jgi:LysR family transcriptional regulator, transcriptional activator of nhaA
MIPANYHHLYYFWVTAKAGSISRAKDQLMLAQPTLSLQLKQLETFFGKRLLERRRDGVVLTAEGRRAFEHCERIFTQGEALIREMKEGQGASMPVRLGVARTVSREIVRRLVDAVQTESRVKVAIVSGALSELRERLMAYAIDLAVANVDLAEAIGGGFTGRLIGSLPAHFVASPEVKRGLGRFPSKGLRFTALVRGPDHPVRLQTLDYIRRHGMEAEVSAETDDTDLLRELAVEGKGVAVLNSLAARAELEAGKLVALNEASTGIKEHLWAAASVSNDPGAAALKRLRDLW